MKQAMTYLALAAIARAVEIPIPRTMGLAQVQEESALISAYQEDFLYGDIDLDLYDHWYFEEFEIANWDWDANDYEDFLTNNADVESMCNQIYYDPYDPDMLCEYNFYINAPSTEEKVYIEGYYESNLTFFNQEDGELDWEYCILYYEVVKTYVRDETTGETEEQVVGGSEMYADNQMCCNAYDDIQVENMDDNTYASVCGM